MPSGFNSFLIFPPNFGYLLGNQGSQKCFLFSQHCFYLGRGGDFRLLVKAQAH